ncbi:hypothetical protein ACFXGR_28575 [Streptomyces mirabilis]|uniref:hypothetical protein n=1 Tax=Streptomyces mirabilis TaxID=68239 RepID=UPI00368A8FF8
MDDGLDPRGDRRRHHPARRARRTGDPAHRPHSPRRGLVAESARAGNPDAVAEKQGGWAKGSKVMRGYREDDDGFTEDALYGVL